MLLYGDFELYDKTEEESYSAYLKLNPLFWWEKFINSDKKQEKVLRKRVFLFKGWEWD